MQAIWEQGSVSEQMRWEVIVLLPKGSSDIIVGLVSWNLFGRLLRKLWGLNLC
jgi:hypothetical protein